MLEKITTSVFYNDDTQNHDFIIKTRNYKTIKNLSDLYEMYENVKASEKTIEIKNSKGELIEIDFSFKKDLEKVNQELKELTQMQETLSYKAYVEKVKELTAKKSSLLENNVLNSKVISYEIEHHFDLNSLSDFNARFEKFAKLTTKFIIVIE